MTVTQSLFDLRNRFAGLAARLKVLESDFNTVSPPAAPTIGEADGKAQIQKLVLERTNLLQVEAEELLCVSDLAHERTRLVLGCEHAIFGDDGVGAVMEEQSSLQQAAAGESLAKMCVNASLEDPQADKARATILQTKIEAAAMERELLVSAVTDQESAPFQEIYSGLANPLATYASNGQDLARGYLTLATTSLDRAENVMTYIGTIDLVVKPLYPDKSDFLTQQQRISWNESLNALKTAGGYMALAERYSKAPKPF